MGLACVLVARKPRHDKVSVCGYLVDVHCLGLKNTLGPLVMGAVRLLAFRRYFFGTYAAEPLVAPLEPAQQLVFAAVDGVWSRCRLCRHTVGISVSMVTSADDDIELGRDGLPFFMRGPYDDAQEVLRTLDRSLGTRKPPCRRYRTSGRLGA